ncbi:YhgE/Pip domain-containing protein [Lysinibacillus sp. LZ02]|uniref:YhgE/Pip domain-containing protein n=1 Tax=Lysinibacillus sp. LZ02 TaxID=3420668 RepID=UPI003D36C651
MKMNKFLISAPIVSFIILFIFVCTQIPIVNQSAKNLPIAIVNEDSGVGEINMGNNIIQQLTAQNPASEESMIAWKIVNLEEMQQGMDDQSYYGAIVIPENFSENYTSFQTATPLSPEINLYVNQGKNATVATNVNQALNSIVNGINEKISSELLATFQAQNVSLSVDQALLYTAPITSSTTMLHPTGSMGNVPLSLFQPIWMGSLFGAMFLWFAMRNRTFNSKMEQLKARLLQIGVSFIIGIVVGFGLTWLATSILNYEFPSFTNTALFLSITCTSFLLLILAVVTWIGMPGVPLFVLLLFFGLPLLQMTPEVMPVFYKDWVYPWLPMRYMIDGLRELLFYDGAVWNESAIVLSSIAIVSAMIILAVIWKPRKEESSIENSQPVNG